MSEPIASLALPQILDIEAKAAKATPPDCGDNSCRFATEKGGMRTNGGCRCYRSCGTEARWYAERMHDCAPPDTVTQLCKMARAYLELRATMGTMRCLPSGSLDSRESVAHADGRDYVMGFTDGQDDVVLEHKAVVLEALTRADEILGKP